MAKRSRLGGVHVLIATTGALSPEPVAHLTKHLAGPDGRVSVTTVIEVPRSFLETIRSEEWRPLDGEGQQWGNQEDAVIVRYVEERGRRIIEPIVAALAAEGLKAEVRYLEGEDPAQVIIDAAESLEADVIVLGATRPIFDESSWESVTLRVMQDQQRPVLIVPAMRRPGNQEEEDEMVESQ